jgi:hypothetical protein
VENAAASEWPSGEEGWQAMVLERDGERVRRPIGHGGECRGGMVALEHVVAMQTRRCSEWRGTDDGLMSGYGCRRVDERIHK